MARTDALADADVVAAEIDSADSARKRLAELGVWREMKRWTHPTRRTSFGWASSWRGGAGFRSSAMGRCGDEDGVHPGSAAPVTRASVTS